MAKTVDGHAGSGPITVFHAHLAELNAHATSSHTEHVLSLLVSGWVRIEHGTPIRLEADTLTLIPAGVPHRLVSGHDAEVWRVGFCAGCLDLDEGQALMAPFRAVRHGALPVVRLAPAQSATILRRLQDLRAEVGRADLVSAEMAESLLRVLLGDVHRAVRGGPAGAQGSLVGDALAFVQQHCFSPISLRDVAAAVYRTPPHVAAIVKDATGHTVGQWITAARVSEAAKRLLHTEDDLDAIAAHVGWKDKTHLIRQFKKAHGETPAAWRRAQRRSHRDA